jgi:hypothetical protein
MDKWDRWTDRQRDRGTDRWTDRRKTDRWTHEQIDRCTDEQKHTHAFTDTRIQTQNVQTSLF